MQAQDTANAGDCDISVVIPAYEEADNIAATLLSVYIPLQRLSKRPNGPNVPYRPNGPIVECLIVVASGTDSTIPAAQQCIADHKLTNCRIVESPRLAASALALSFVAPSGCTSPGVGQALRPARRRCVLTNCVAYGGSRRRAAIWLRAFVPDVPGR